MKQPDKKTSFYIRLVNPARLHCFCLLCMQVFCFNAFSQKQHIQFELIGTIRGFGIDEKHSARHTRNKYPGSGIGLSQCKKIVELHRGNIRVESSLREGTTFHFTIPENKNI